jgi:hypothetical protein
VSANSNTPNAGGRREQLRHAVAVALGVLTQQMQGGCPKTRFKAAEVLLRYWSAGYRHRRKKAKAEQKGKKVVRYTSLADILGDDPFASVPVYEEDVEESRFPLTLTPLPQGAWGAVAPHNKRERGT